MHNKEENQFYAQSFSQPTDNPENLTWLRELFMISEVIWSTLFRFTDSSKDLFFSASGCRELLRAKIAAQVASNTTLDKLKPGTFLKLFFVEDKLLYFISKPSKSFVPKGKECC